MAVPTIEQYFGNLRFSRLLCSLSVFVYAVQAVLPPSFNSLVVIADQPAGCYVGPDSDKTGHDTKPQGGTCIYTLRGTDAKGVPQESGGIMIYSNIPEHDGFMRVQVDMLESDFPEYPDVVVTTSGSAHLQLDAQDGMRFTWSADAGDQFRTQDPGNDEVYIKSVVHGYFPDGKEASTTPFDLHSYIHSTGIFLHNYPYAKATGDSGVELETRQRVVVSKVEGGWQFTVLFQAKGQDIPGNTGEYLNYVVDDTLEG
ncbi:hypothetical protein FOZ62_001030 [Perkinsus olseni]|uniref:Uncharacterized protein n=1 Tax=Perkinsus olseni TaxID=32597 RepID=A0A7J6S253_PEROL|nr:hypothetical protein FOZ62_001030 [Perkinsus olseni]